MMHGTSWEADIRTADQEVTHLLWNPKVLYRIYKGIPLFPILSQINLFHVLIPSFFKIHFNIIHLSTHRFPKWSPFRLSDQNCTWICYTSYTAIGPAHLILLIGSSK